MCIFEGCKKRSYFNYEGQTKPQYCGEHRLNNMFDIKHPKCIYVGCKNQPTFNYKGVNRGLYCSIHKLNTMVNIVNKTCKTENCKTRPNYNYENKIGGIYCGIHKLDGMINVTSKRCSHQDCKKQPNYNYEGEIHRLFCNNHKLNGMVNITSKTCKTYLCPTRVTEKYEGYCLFCYINTYPDKPVSRNYKTKEYSVVEYVKTNFSHLTWISDKTIQDGCSKRRPDLFLDMGYQIIILEIDENQHTDYDCSCENKRIMELSQDVNHRPIIFIRFNPDEYTNQDNKISSCWGITKNGICIIKESKKKEWSRRLESLGEQINYWINPVNKTDKTIEVVQLFYDN